MSSNHASHNGHQPHSAPFRQWSRLAAFELAPTTSRARKRDAIIQDQINSPALIWQQVGALLQGALVRESARTK